MEGGCGEKFGRPTKIATNLLPYWRLIFDVHRLYLYMAVHSLLELLLAMKILVSFGNENSSGDSLVDPVHTLRRCEPTYVLTYFLMKCAVIDILKKIISRHVNQYLLNLPRHTYATDSIPKYSKFFSSTFASKSKYYGRLEAG